MISSAKFNVSNDSFAVTFDAIPPQACIPLLTASTGPGRDPGMFAATGQLAGLPVSATPSPLLAAGGLTIPASQSLCTGTGTNGNQVSFYFTLRAGT